jgi:hypothetical protein
MTLNPHPRKPAKSAFIRVLFQACTLGFFFPTLVGCYNAEALRKERQVAATNVRLEEIDLGAFRVALPHILGEANDSVVDFHAFGHVSEQDVAAVKRILETRMPELRAQMLVSIRGMQDSTFKEPKLDALRQNIAQVVNGQLETPAVKSVGFYNFTFSTM